MLKTRAPAVAGQFYPSNARELARDIHGYLHEAHGAPLAPKAIIAPHAGYLYSGPIAASAYACLLPAKGVIKRVILLGPSHRVFLRGIALCSADSYSTPLGQVPIDLSAEDNLKQLPQVVCLDQAHALEHSLEVHLPFLQVVLETFSLVPLVVGEATAEEVAEVLEALWGNDDTLVVVSSDLSHYHDYFTAKRRDQATTMAIEACHTDLSPEQACGCGPLNGLLRVVKNRRLRVTTLDLRNSGDTAGPRDNVVGYGAYAIH
jgi:AmmeMemoRadiSam system protein B